MKALQSGVPFLAITSAVTTAVNGTPFAIPIKKSPIVSVLVVPTGSVSAFSYDLQGSVDGVTYVTLAAAVTTQPLIITAQQVLKYPICRINQVSRTGGTSQDVYATLGQS